jgi:hypothetical protein
MRTNDIPLAARNRANVVRGDAEQAAFFQWSVLNRKRYPDLAYLFAIPNGSKLAGSPGRRAAQWARLEKEGTRKGIPDYCLPVARGPYHGLWIELKSTKTAKVTPEQRGWIAALNEQGHRAAVCRGWQEAAALVVQYMESK